MHPIYLDNNASTPLLPPVWEAMLPYLQNVAGNPASSHRSGQAARRALDDAREKTASLLDAQPDEIVFTSGATEANNLAIFGLAGKPPSQLVSSAIEHPCITEPLARLKDFDFCVEHARPSEEGIVSRASIESLMRPDARLVTVLLANHETGAIQPIADLVDASRGTAFHCDAAAAAGKMPISFRDLGVTTLTISAHKFHGPKGVGALVVRRGTRLQPLIFGGHQQQGRRPGTEPVFLAVGLATALELAVSEMDERLAGVKKLRRRFLDGLRSFASPIVVNGPTDERVVPHTCNISFPGCPADVLLMNLDLASVACSTGSACSSGSLLPSPVLRAMAVPDEVLHSAMRFSFNHLLSEEEVDQAARRIADVVERIRRIDVDE